jgi:putative hemolysin
MMVSNLRRLCAMAGLALALAACSSGPTPAPAAESDAGTSGAPDAQACAAQGGTLQPLGRRGLPQCVVTYADAGKVCRDDAECTGRCLATGEIVAGQAASGTCQRDVRENFGCRQWIEQGVARPTICID